MSDKFVMSARQAAELDHAFERNNWTPADVKRLSEGNVLTQVKKFLGLSLPQEVRVGTHLTINYTLTFEQMIALGRYDWTNSDITAKRFPITGTGVIEVEHKLFHFDRTVSSDEAEGLIIADGYQLAKIEHLLAYGTANPEEQRKFPIVALGSVAEVSGKRSVPCLYGDDAERRLNLSWWFDGWNGYYRFLAVRNLAL